MGERSVEATRAQRPSLTFQVARLTPEDKPDIPTPPARFVNEGERRYVGMDGDRWFVTAVTIEHPSLVSGREITLRTGDEVEVVSSGKLPRVMVLSGGHKGAVVSVHASHLTDKAPAP